jgi:hypothetical protein
MGFAARNLGNVHGRHFPAFFNHSNSNPPTLRGGSSTFPALAAPIPGEVAARSIDIRYASLREYASSGA